MYAREGLLGDVLGAANRLAWSANACSLPAAGTEQPSALIRPAFLFKLAPSHLIILRLGHPPWAAAAFHAARQHRRDRNRGRRSSWAPTKRGLGLDPFARHLLRITPQADQDAWMGGDPQLSRLRCGHFFLAAAAVALLAFFRPSYFASLAGTDRFLPFRLLIS